MKGATSAISPQAGAQRLPLAPVATLLVSVGLLVLGNGLLGTLLVVRAGHEEFPGEAIGLMMSAYFGGYAAGATLLPRLVASVGHIRTFAGFASIASAVGLLHLLVLDIWAWTLLRAVSGLAYAGMIVVAESWLNAQSSTRFRGRLLSIYGMVTMGVWAASQGLLNLAPPSAATLFLVVSILISVALVPLVLLPSHPPAPTYEPPIGLRQLFDISPLGTLGVVLAGLAFSAFWGLGPNFAELVGLGTGGVSAFMAAVLIGALVLQWPLGWLSDRFPRRLVIAAAALGAALAALGVAGQTGSHLPSLLAFGFLFGGFGIPIYTLCVAHANDCMEVEQTVGAARGLLLLNGAGAALGPLLAGFAMRWLGPGGLFLNAAALLSLLTIIAILRRFRGPSRDVTNSPLPCTPQVAMTLDTRSTERSRGLVG